MSGESTPVRCPGRDGVGSGVGDPQALVGFPDHKLWGGVIPNAGVSPAVDVEGPVMRCRDLSVICTGHVLPRQQEKG